VFEQLTVFENLELALKTDKGVRPRCASGSIRSRSDRIAEVLRHPPG
jgi:urea transport system ATP-binding protein